MFQLTKEDNLKKFYHILFYNFIFTNISYSNYSQVFIPEVDDQLK